jgi:hypothetical protein
MKNPCPASVRHVTPSTRTSQTAEPDLTAEPQGTTASASNTESDTHTKRPDDEPCTPSVGPQSNGQSSGFGGADHIRSTTSHRASPSRTTQAMFRVGVANQVGDVISTSVVGGNSVDCVDGATGAAVVGTVRSGLVDPPQPAEASAKNKAMAIRHAPFLNRLRSARTCTESIPIIASLAAAPPLMPLPGEPRSVPVPGQRRGQSVPSNRSDRRSSADRKAGCQQPTFAGNE